MERNKILQGDARKLAKTLPDESVSCVVTSPPYLGLRDYGTATWEGGDPNCDHVRISRPKRDSSGGVGRKDTRGEQSASTYQIGYGDICKKCGAKRTDDQIGLESSVEEYVEALVEIFRELRRVLHPSGTLWLNLGSSYAGNRTNQVSDSKHLDVGNNHGSEVPSGYKPKDLIPVPWLVALALQADGWWLRNEIIWAKRAPMPESVTDRFTSSHEHVFLLAKRPNYFFDAEAVKEPDSGKSSGNGYTRSHRLSYDGRGQEDQWHGGSGRNKRDVWTLGPDPFPNAHFATFPRKLVETCILAGTSAKGICPSCGAPWRRIVEKEFVPQEDVKDPDKLSKGSRKGMDASNRWGDSPRGSNRYVEKGWQPSCNCNAGEPVPAIVLDPFMGAGTVGVVARDLGRDYLGFELNPKYVEMAEERIGNTQPTLFPVGLY